MFQLKPFLMMPSRQGSGGRSVVGNSQCPNSVALAATNPRNLRRNTLSLWLCEILFMFMWPHCLVFQVWSSSHVNWYTTRKKACFSYLTVCSIGSITVHVYRVNWVTECCLLGIITVDIRYIPVSIKIHEFKMGDRILNIITHLLWIRGLILHHFCCGLPLYPRLKGGPGMLCFLLF